MSVLRPFRAVRPVPEYAPQVASLPYDVMSSEEAYVMVKDKPYSFMRIDRAEVNFPRGTDQYSEQVYLKAREILDSLEDKGIFAQDEKPMFYIYRQVMNGRVQTGLVGCTSIDEYNENKIKKHELTRADKEIDRINHVNYCDANTGPIFLVHRPRKELKDLFADWTGAHAPVYDFITEDGIGSTVWAVDDDETVKRISEIFKGVEALYIADGHHRANSAVKVGLMRRQENPGYDGSEEFNYFLAVLFASDELKIMPYNRVAKMPTGISGGELLRRISEKFEVEEVGREPYAPDSVHSFGMLMGNVWYKLTAKEGTFDPGNVIDSLDVSILQNNLIGPVLGISDPRKSKRIDFVGGIRGLGELVKRANTDMELAFSMYPTSVDELMNIADAGEIMPPKSTWFEPKLLSGLFIHKLK